MIDKNSVHVLIALVLLNLFLCPQLTLLAEDNVIDKLLENVIHESKELIEKPIVIEAPKVPSSDNFIVHTPLDDSYKDYQLLSAQVLGSGNLEPSSFTKLKAYSNKFFHGPLGENLVYHLLAYSCFLLEHHWVP